MKRFTLFLSVVFLGCSLSQAQIIIDLRKSFVDSLKNRVTLTSEYYIDKVKDQPNSPSDDGDLHIAGRDLRVGLPVVAEIMNARKEKDAMLLAHESEGTGHPVELTGAWRIWCEHAAKGEEEYLQGTRYDPFTTTNPGHVFELHPVTRIAGEDLASSLKPIKGFDYKDPDMAFGRFDKVSFRLENLDHRVRIVTEGVGFNYIRFRMQLLDSAPLRVEDGAFVFVRVMDEKGHVVVPRVRAAFVRDSGPYEKLLTMKKGETADVVGIPRISLSIVSWRLNNAGKDPAVLLRGLPYELVIVAVIE